MTDEMREEIRLLIRRVLYPGPLLRWMTGLTEAERIGRIRRSKQSVLRYGIRQFLIFHLSYWLKNIEDPDWFDYRLLVEPMDEEVIIRGTSADPATEWEVTVEYPFWLRDFLEDDENFEYMVPGNDTKLEEVLQRIHAWCRSHPPYDMLVASVR